MEDQSRQPRKPLDVSERRMLQAKRLQRAAEYALLVGVHAFFVVSFSGFIEWWMAVALTIITFGLNFQLTMLREQRRHAGGAQRGRILADTLESILFLGLIVAMSFGESIAGRYQLSSQEYLGYVAATLGGIFLAGLLGELYWQRKYFRRLDQAEQHVYIANLKRTIIFPYFASRSR